MNWNEFKEEVRKLPALYDKLIEAKDIEPEHETFEETYFRRQPWAAVERKIVQLRCTFINSAEDDFEKEKRKQIMLKSGFWFTSADQLSRPEYIEEKILKGETITDAKFEEILKAEEDKKAKRKEIEEVVTLAPEILKRVRKARTGIISEREMNKLRGLSQLENSRMQVDGADDRGVFWIFDLVADKLVKENDCQAIKEPGMIVSLKEVEEIGETKEPLTSITLTSEEIREKLDLPYPLPHWKICEMVRKAFRVAIWGDVKTFWDGHKLQEVTIFKGEHLFVNAEARAIRTFQNRKGVLREHREKYEFTFQVGGRLGLIFLNNLYRARYVVHDKRIYRLSYPCERLVRYTSCFRDTSHFTLDQIVRLMGFKNSNISVLQKQVEGKLEEAKEAGYVWAWRREGKGSETSYHVFKPRKKIQSIKT